MWSFLFSSQRYYTSHSKHKTSFCRWYNVVLTSTTLLQRRKYIVCLLGSPSFLFLKQFQLSIVYMPFFIIHGCVIKSEQVSYLKWFTEKQITNHYVYYIDGLPSLNFANHCNYNPLVAKDHNYNLYKRCPKIEADIKHCQSKGMHWSIPW